MPRQPHPARPALERLTNIANRYLGQLAQRDPEASAALGERLQHDISQLDAAIPKTAPAKD